MQTNFIEEKCQRQKNYASLEVFTLTWLRVSFSWDMTKHHIPDKWSPKKGHHIPILTNEAQTWTWTKTDVSKKGKEKHGGLPHLQQCVNQITSNFHPLKKMGKGKGIRFLDPSKETAI
jgi:hypothetical protein